jgi:repressor LexA
MATRTKRQHEVLEYISSFIERHGYEPSYFQIARHFRFSSKTAVAKHVAALETQGLLTRRNADGKFSLSIKTEQSLTDAVCRVPLFKKLSEEMDETGNEPLFVPRFLLGGIQPEKIFAFRVLNDSMIDEHICEGDFALLERRYTAEDGECVLALIENRHPTLERFYDYTTEVELRPSNTHLSTLRLPVEFVTICGVFRGLLRSSTLT